MNVSPQERLTNCEPEHFRVYFDWRLEGSSIAKLSTIWTEWKFLRLLYQREVGRKIDQVVGTEISEVGSVGRDPSFTLYWANISWQYIMGPLQDEYGLDLSIRDKPTLGVEDLLVILRYHWCFDTASVPHERYTVQLPLLILITAFTASRPGALVESGCARGSNEALRYRDASCFAESHFSDGGVTTFYERKEE
jgi:Protein of unknown function (DUF3435)